MEEKKDDLAPADTRDPLEPPVVDGLLELLSGHVNDTEGEIGITVSARGAVISGRMVGRDEWLEAMKTHFGEEKDAPLSKFWGHFTRDQLPTVDDGKTPVDWHLHLVGARYISGAHAVPSSLKGLKMRVRLTEVDSWSLTMIGGDPDEDAPDNA